MKTAALAILTLITYVARGQVITTFAGTGLSGFNMDGIPATSAKLYQPGELCIDLNGSIYINDAFNYRIRKVDTFGVITTVVGTGSSGYNGDSIAATSAQINLVGTVAIGPDRNLYFADANNHRIRKVNLATGIIYTVAGNGTAGFAGDGGVATAANLNYPGHIAFDGAGNYYISDVGNRRVRMVDTDGIIRSVVGNGMMGFAGDGGPATGAEINSPEGLACDSLGNLFIADRPNGRVRKLNVSTGIITTFAGIGVGSYTGDGFSATACAIAPQGLTFDPHGNLIIADLDQRILKIDSAGIVTTVAGTGIAGYNGDGVAASSAELNLPWDVKFDLCGNMLIADVQNERIRKVTYPPTLTIPTISLSGISSTVLGATVTLNASVAQASSSYLIHWMNHGVEFTATTVPVVIYTKGPGTDTITARVVPTGYGCWDSTTSAGHVVFDANEGIAIPTDFNPLMVYPNPACNEITVISSAVQTEIVLYDLPGHEMIRRQLTGKKNIIDIRSLPPGMYLLSIYDDAGKMTVTRFIKEQQ